ncbi:MAG: NADH-dependent [FeFe] hydrogenase, group A6 [Bacillota bacterium]
MVTLKIDRKEVRVAAGTTVLEASKAVGLRIPTLCYLQGVNEIGACRVCVVELKGKDKLITACNTVVQEGMEISTASPRVRHARRMAVELLLTQHDCNCPTCSRNGACKLQSLANALGVRNVRLKREMTGQRADESSPSIVRDPQKCILCYRCVSVCDKVQSLGIWRIAGTGARTAIEPAFGQPLAATDCAYCGQCVTHCPVGALSEKNDRDKAWDALSDPDKVVVVQVAPAVRAAWGEGLGMTREAANMKRLVATLRHLGFDYVFDTAFAADLTIMEEGTELLERLAGAGKGHSKRKSNSAATQEHVLPMFTSCCPGWVRFLKSQYPELVPNLSTAKSPQQMFGAVAKAHFARAIGVPVEKLFVVSIMPCTAKKYEAGLDAMTSSAGGPDVDLVLTTRELVAMVKEEGVWPEGLAEEEFDSPMGTGTGAAVIFGSTGGVMEAALRSAYFLATGKNPEPDAFKAVRGPAGWKEATFELPGKSLRCAVVSGLGQARQMIEALKEGKAQYDFVEVMACPGGCAGGGGQPVSGDDRELHVDRSKNLYQIDSSAPIRFSHENPDVQQLYKDFLGKPCSELAHHLLHTDQRKWKLSDRLPESAAKRAANMD